MAVVVCSSFKFPPTALDEDASEEFRTRESQVRAESLCCTVLFIRLRRYAEHKMWPLVLLMLVGVGVCASVGYNCELCCDSLTDWCHLGYEHLHHQVRIASEGRRVVAPPCPRSTTRLQRSPIRRVESFRSCSSHLFCGRPGGRRHVRSGGRLSDNVDVELKSHVCRCDVVKSSHMPKYRDALTGWEMRL